MSARLALAVVVLAAACLALSASAAAQTGHVFQRQLPSNPAGATEGVAVDASGDVFAVTHSGNEPLIDVYSPSGELKTSFGLGEIEEGEVPSIAVDADGRVYVVSPVANAMYVFSPQSGPFGAYKLVATWTGANLPGHEFGGVTAVAIDTSTEKKSDPHAEDIYIVEGETLVDIIAPPAKETEEGKPVGELLGHPEFAEIKAIAVNPSTGQVYVAAEAAEKLQVEIFGGAGNFERKQLGTKTPPKDFGSISGIGVDGTTGDLYVVDSEDAVVDEFNATGEYVGWLTATESGGEPQPFIGPVGVAVASAGSTKGDVYVTDSVRQVIDAFGPNTTVPGVETGKASKVERQGAILNGVVSAEGKEAKYYFEFGETGGPATKKCEGSTTATPTPVQCAVSGLKAGHSYTFRVIASTKETGPTEGGVVTFETSPAVTSVTTEAATSITGTSATLTGSMRPQGIETEYRFEYGEPQGITEVFGKQAPVPYGHTDLGGTVTVQVPITNLRPNTEYNYRLVAFNAFGTTFGTGLNFRTTGPTIQPATDRTPNAYERRGQLADQPRQSPGQQIQGRIR